jgi:predicted small secreted protein
VTCRRLAVPLVVALAVLVAGCGPADGVVRDKRERPGTLGVTVRELCIGESRQTCTWSPVGGKTSKTWYRRCDIGERYPDCRKSG